MSGIRYFQQQPWHFFHDQKQVSVIFLHVFERHFHTYSCMTIRVWVIFSILQKATSLYHFLNQQHVCDITNIYWDAASWYCSHYQQHVRNFKILGNTVLQHDASLPITNSLWVIVILNNFLNPHMIHLCLSLPDSEWRVHTFSTGSDIISLPLTKGSESKSIHKHNSLSHHYWTGSE